LLFTKEDLLAAAVELIPPEYYQQGSCLCPLMRFVKLNKRADVQQSVMRQDAGTVLSVCCGGLEPLPGPFRTGTGGALFVLSRA